MKPETRILRMVAPDCGGPRKRRILEATAERYGATAQLVKDMIAAGLLVMYGKKRGATWGLPR